MQRFLYCILLSFLSFGLRPQAARKQELVKLISETKLDSLKCLYLVELIENETDNTIWPSYNADLKQITLKHLNPSDGNEVDRFYLSKYADALVNEGFLMQQNSKLSEALQLYKQGLDIKLDLKLRKESSVILINIGFLFQETADYPKAYKYYKRALAIQEELNDKENAAVTLMNLASISLSQYDTTPYAVLVEKALEYRIGINDKRGTARCYNALAVIEGNKKDRSKAFYYLNKAIAINKELDDKEGLGNSYNNLGGLYFREGDLDKSSLYFNIAYKLNVEVKDNGSSSTSLKNLGDISFKKGDFQQAHEYYLKALEKARYSGIILAQERAATGLVRSSKALNLKKEISLYRNLAEKLTDSVERKVNIQLAGLTRLLDPDSNLTPDPALTSSKVVQSNIPSYGLVIILSLCAIILILSFIYFKRKKGST